MKFKHSLIAAAALAAAFGAAQAADNKQASRDTPGFNEMDKDDDGWLTRAEAGGNPQLVQRFKEADRDGDGKLSRFEYLRVVTRQDFARVRETVTGLFDRDEKASAGGTSSASSGSTRK